MAVTEGTLPPRYAAPRRIGHGGMGDIFAAEDSELGREVAVKVLAERYASDEALRERFKREALAVARLSGHPHIVTIYDVGEWEGRPFIVMELLGGGSLAERARSGTVAVDDALAWLEQAAEAIDAAHSEGIVHRDVKPANLLFDGRGELKVADFGIARVLDDSTAGMTQTGMVLGTSGYLSPEQASGTPASAASDVYSLGVVAYELLTGGRPFERSSTTAEAAAHIHEPVPSASARGVGLPRSVDAVFERALAKAPEDRHATARELVEDLRGVLTAPAPTRVAAGSPAAAPTVRRAAAPRFRPGWLVPVLAALLAGGVLLAVMLADDGDGSSTTTRGRPTVVTQQGETVVTTVVETVTTAPEESPPPPPSPPAAPPPSPPPAAGGLSAEEAAAQNDQAYALMNAGRYEEALPLIQEALPALRGVSPNEAYAEYNLGKTLLELGRCDEALSHLERSEQLQGARGEITAAKEAAQNC